MINAYIYDVPDTLIRRAGRGIVKIDANQKAAYCKGCYGCWLQKPGKCVLADHLETVGSLVLQADTLTIISACCYGGYSPKVKRVLDRCIPGVMPFFITKHNDGRREQHHRARYSNRMKLSVWFYGASNTAEQETARKLVHANALNYWAREVEVHFVESPEEVLL